MTLTSPGRGRHTPLVRSGVSRPLTPMQEQLRAAIALMVPATRRGHRQGWQRKEILSRRTPACRLLEQLIDEAVLDGVADPDIERVGLALLDAIRQKLDARHPRPLGVPSLGAAIREEEAVEGEMAPLEIDVLTGSTPGRLTILREFYWRHEARIRDAVRAINANLQGHFG